MLFEPYVRFHTFIKFGKLSGRLLEIAAHSAYNMFSNYKYLIVNLVFTTSVLLSGSFFLIAPFPDY